MDVSVDLGQFFVGRNPCLVLQLALITFSSNSCSAAGGQLGIDFIGRPSSRMFNNLVPMWNKRRKRIIGSDRTTSLIPFHFRYSKTSTKTMRYHGHERRALRNLTHLMNTISVPFSPVVLLGCDSDRN